MVIFFHTDGWIPCNSDFLEILESSNQIVDIWVEDKEHGYRIENCVYSDGKFCINENSAFQINENKNLQVTHFMALPEAPQVSANCNLSKMQKEFLGRMNLIKRFNEKAQKLV